MVKQIDKLNNFEFKKFTKPSCRSACIGACNSKLATMCNFMCAASTGDVVQCNNLIISKTSWPWPHIVWFQRTSIPLPQRVISNSKDNGVLKAKIFKGKYSCMCLNWNFQRGGGFKPKKNSLCGEYGYFLEQHIMRNDYEETFIWDCSLLLGSQSKHTQYIQGQSSYI